jgi:hypothetical protein
LQTFEVGIGIDEDHPVAKGRRLVTDGQNDPAEGRRVLPSLLTTSVTVTPRQACDRVVFDWMVPPGCLDTVAIAPFCGRTRAA